MSKGVLQNPVDARNVQPFFGFRQVSQNLEDEKDGSAILRCQRAPRDIGRSS